MDDHPNDLQVNVREVDFGKGRIAKLALVPVSANVAELLPQLGLNKPQAVVLVIGGADELDQSLVPQLEQLLSRGIARAALDTNAAIIDGGTRSGVMALMGEAVADRGHQSTLIGVAPALKVAYPNAPAEGDEERTALEPNHTHFVLITEPDWGDEVDLMYALAQELSESSPVVAVLVNGGKVAKEEAVRAVRHRWPMIVIEGSGRLADEIAAAAISKQSSIADPDLAEIIAEGNIHLFSKNGSPAELRRLAVQQLSGNAALRVAWERFAKYDGNAQRQQESFSNLLWWTIWLGVTATVLAVLQKDIAAHLPRDQASWPATMIYLSGFLKYVILIVPITISILVAATSRFKTGKKWVLLRGSAEAIKREIFHYRTRTGSYSDAEVARANTTREARLSRVVGNIASRISQTEVNELALKAYDGSLPPPYAAAASDDGMSVLAPDAYISSRLEDQLSYFESKTVKLEKQLRWRQWTILLIGGAGTLLAALHQEIWIAVTTAFGTALAAHLEHFQIESTLVRYNQSASDLLTVKSWWRSLTEAEQNKPAHRDLLVESTERILENELTGWVQRMQDAMDKVTAGQKKGEEDDEDHPENIAQKGKSDAVKTPGKPSPPKRRSGDQPTPAKPPDPPDISQP